MESETETLTGHSEVEVFEDVTKNPVEEETGGLIDNPEEDKDGEIKNPEDTITGKETRRSSVKGQPDLKRKSLFVNNL